MAAEVSLLALRPRRRARRRRGFRQRLGDRRRVRARHAGTRRAESGWVGRRDIGWAGRLAGRRPALLDQEALCRPLHLRDDGRTARVEPLGRCLRDVRHVRPGGCALIHARILGCALGRRCASRPGLAQLLRHARHVLARVARLEDHARLGRGRPIGARLLRTGGAVLTLCRGLDHDAGVAGRARSSADERVRPAGCCELDDLFRACAIPATPGAGWTGIVPQSALNEKPASLEPKAVMVGVSDHPGARSPDSVWHLQPWLRARGRDAHQRRTKGQ